jgi:polypeptide deformylase
LQDGIAPILDPDDPYRYLEIRGVVDIEDDPERKLVDRLSKKYYGKKPSQSQARGRESHHAYPPDARGHLRSLMPWRGLVQGTSAGGERVVVATEGCEACAYQHEIDHLYGMLILDRVESQVTDVFRRRIIAEAFVLWVTMQYLLVHGKKDRGLMWERSGEAPSSGSACVQCWLLRALSLRPPPDPPSARHEDRSRT